MRQFINKVNRQIAANQLDSALYLIQSFVEKIVIQPESMGIVLSSFELDQLCWQIGEKVLQQNVIAKSVVATDLIVYVATQLYNSGGHTAVIEDFIRYQPNKKHIILLTDIFDATDRAAVSKRFAELPVEIQYAPKQKSLAFKVNWLQKTLLQLQPSKTFLFNHYQDAVPIAALQPNLVPQLYFFHHADHQLCLGVHLEHTIHIDAQSFGFQQCRDKFKLKNNIYWPLVARDQGARENTRIFMRDGTLITCSSGSSIKFAGPYAYEYFELLPEILATTQGKHVHIGPMTAAALKALNKNLDKKGISRDRLIWLPWVKSLWQTVLQQNVDVYLNSFPISGGKATVEMQGAGMPIIMHENYRSNYLGQVYIAYPQVFYWKKPEELFVILRQLTPDMLQQHSQYARQHYERYHHPDLLKAELAQPAIDSRGLIPAPLPEYQGDPLCLFLERKNHSSPKYLLKKYLLGLVFSHPRLTAIARAIRRHWKSISRRVR